VPKIEDMLSIEDLAKIGVAEAIIHFNIQLRQERNK
jgi:hypothetical protein